MTTIAIIVIFLVIFRKPLLKVAKISFKTIATIFFVCVLLKSFKDSSLYTDLRNIYSDLPEEEAVIKGTKEVGKDLIITGKNVAKDGFYELAARGTARLDSIK